MAGPVLKAYQETPRDRIANALFSMTGRGPLATRFVEGMTGSTGLGANQMGVVDFSPIGPFLQAYEAGQQIGTKGQRGQGVANAMMAMVPIPGAAKGVNALAKAVGKGGEKRAVNALAQAAEQQAPQIIAYHGSPHSFDRFDVNQIGTGQGESMFGRGLYFSEDESVAKYYRDLPSIYNGKTIYQVGIDADPSAFLNWDIPLSQQSPEVRAAVGRLMGEDIDNHPGWLKTTGEKAYWGINERMRRNGVAEPQLSAEGVPGIQFNSQSNGTGPRNYVVFDDKLITILKKYGWVPGAAIPAAAAYEYAQALKSPQQPREAL